MRRPWVPGGRGVRPGDRGPKDYWEVVRGTWAGIYEDNDRFVFVPRLENKSLISKQFKFADSYQGGMSQQDLEKHAEGIIFPHINK